MEDRTVARQRDYELPVEDAVSDFLLRRQCRYVYCRKYFETLNASERYCCRDHMLAQTRYNDRKRRMRKYQIKKEQDAQDGS